MEVRSYRTGGGGGGDNTIWGGIGAQNAQRTPLYLYIKKGGARFRVGDLRIPCRGPLDMSWCWGHVQGPRF